MSANYVTKARRNYQDSVFRLLFSDKESVIELYNALEGTDYGLETDVEFTTLEDSLYIGIKNDLGFIIAEKYVVLTEHQSTINLNIAVRHLEYLGRTYEKELDNHSIYRRKRVPIPTPEFYVLYTGEEKWEDEYIRLSDSFIAEAPENSVELVVKIINVRYNKDEYNEVLERSKKLRGYSVLLGYIREYKAETGNLTEAIHIAVKRCLDEGILADFLTSHSAEVGSMLFDDISVEEFLEIRGEEAREDGFKQGLEEGREEGLEQGIKQGLEEGIKQGLEEGIKQGIEQGLEEGIEQGIEKMLTFYKHKAFTSAQAQQDLMEIYTLSQEESELYMKKYWK